MSAICTLLCLKNKKKRNDIINENIIVESIVEIFISENIFEKKIIIQKIAK